jgi:hypothetical protein
MNELEEIFDQEGQYIRFFIGKETTEDDFEGTTSLEYTNSLPIKALVSDLGMGKIQWSMPGITTDKAKEIIIESKHRNLFEQTHKIKIDDEYYYGWKQNGKLQYKISGNYLTAYIYYKKA